MNLTLSIDERTIKRGRKVARAMGKSLNALVREYLASLSAAQDVEREIAELRLLSRRGKGNSRGKCLNREEVNTRVAPGSRL